MYKKICYVSAISKKKKKENQQDMALSCCFQCSELVHRYGYSKESLYQQSPVPQTTSSLVHEGLVLPLVGKQSQENRVLPLIEAKKRHKANNNSKMCCFAYNFNGIILYCYKYYNINITIFELNHVIMKKKCFCSSPVRPFWTHDDPLCSIRTM